MHCEVRQFKVESKFAKDPNKKSSFLHCMQKYRRVKSKCLFSVISGFPAHDQTRKMWWGF